jgi:2-oxoglutarate ferredoxin oxidoreductase subunit gamma
MKYQIRYAAVGGQGIITAGQLLVHIAAEKENLNAVESPTYTAAVRGGPTKVDVVISEEKILFPQVTNIDFFLCTDQRSYELYSEKIDNNAIVVVDSHLVHNLGNTHNWKVYQIPLINETKKTVGNIVLTSVVSLSITQKLTNIISYDNMVEYVKKWAPKGAVDINLKAIELGIKLI